MKQLDYYNEHFQEAVEILIRGAATQTHREIFLEELLQNAFLRGKIAAIEEDMGIKTKTSPKDEIWMLDQDTTLL